MSYKSFADTNFFLVLFLFLGKCVKLTSICRGTSDGEGQGGVREGRKRAEAKRDSEGETRERKDLEEREQKEE